MITKAITQAKIGLLIKKLAIDIYLKNMERRSVIAEA
jgi:hypothetical protein